MEPEMWMVGEQLAAVARDAAAAAKRLLNLADGLTGAIAAARGAGMGDEEMAGYTSTLGEPLVVAEALRSGEAAILTLILGTARRPEQTGVQDTTNESVAT